MTTEYTLNGSHHGPAAERSGVSLGDSNQQAIAERVTSGYLMSYGMAIGLSNLVPFLQKKLGATVDIIGDKGRRQPRAGRSVVVLGSPSANRYLERLVPDLCRHYPLLGRFEWTLGPNGVSLTLPEGATLTPDVNAEENGTDYALVASAKLDQVTGARIIMISGCSMWATEAATRFLLNRRLLRLVPRRARKSEAVAFVVKASIEGGEPDRIELYALSTGDAVYNLKPAAGPRAPARPAASV